MVAPRAVGVSRGWHTSAHSEARILCARLKTDVVLKAGDTSMSKLISWVAVAAVLAAFSGVSAAQTTRDTGTIVNDAWITTQVYARFFLDADIKGRNIKVETVSGVVTLSGNVQSSAERNQAVAKAKAVEGVKQVVDKLGARTGRKGDPVEPWREEFRIGAAQRRPGEGACEECSRSRWQGDLGRVAYHQSAGDVFSRSRCERDGHRRGDQSGRRDAGGHR